MGEIRTLAVRQPWATYIAEGTKTVEVRTWATRHRGPVLIVASGRPLRHADEAGAVWVLPARVQVCTVELVEVRPMVPADEALAHVPCVPGAFAWVVERPRMVRPAPHRGRLGLYRTPSAGVHVLPDGEHYLDCMGV